MKTLVKKIFLAAIALAVLLSPALAGEWTVYKVAAAEEKGYGEKKPVATEKEARAALKEYYKGKEVEIGEIEEKELYFEAEVFDSKGELIDRVIIDKRTGRVRSIY